MVSLIAVRTRPIGHDDHRRRFKTPPEMLTGATKERGGIYFWPSGEFAAIGLEGAVRLGFAKELAAVANLNEREALFKKLVDEEYLHGKAINVASTLEIDAVIDPAETGGDCRRRWLLRTSVR